MVTKSRKNDGALEIVEVNTTTLEVALVGTTPIILNRMAEKARQELLMPRGPKTAAERAGTLKHNPLVEFRSAATQLQDEQAATLLAIPASALKGAIRTAALDQPGLTKSQIGRLTYVEGTTIGIFGTPEVFTTIVRSADAARTPDVRTRCIVPKWAAIASVRFVRPIIREQALANLIAAAGITVGLGDWRPEKGAGNYGQFRVAGADDAELLHLMQHHGRAAQIEAMVNPTAHDDETEELLGWFDAEVRHRGFKLAA